VASEYSANSLSDALPKKIFDPAAKGGSAVCAGADEPTTCPVGQVRWRKRPFLLVLEVAGHDADWGGFADLGHHGPIGQTLQRLDRGEVDLGEVFVYRFVDACAAACAKLGLAVHQESRDLHVSQTAAAAIDQHAGDRNILRPGTVCGDDGKYQPQCKSGTQRTS
jgi:hypothetical protein